MIGAAFVVKPLVFPRLLSSRECKHLVSFALSNGMETAPLVGAWEGARVGDVVIQSILDPNFAWLQKRLAATFSEANKDYRFELANVSDIVQIARYSEGGQFVSGRGIDLRCLDLGEVETNLAAARQKITVKQGIEQVQAKKISALLKESRIKVDTQIQGDKLRVSGKKRDDLQTAIALLRKAELEVPLQFDNFRD